MAILFQISLGSVNFVGPKICSSKLSKRFFHFRESFMVFEKVSPISLKFFFIIYKKNIEKKTINSLWKL